MLAKKLSVCPGPLSELELRMLTEGSLRISLNDSAFLLNLNKDMKIFEEVSLLKDVSQSDSWDMTFPEFRDKLKFKEIKTDLFLDDAQRNMIHLKKKLSEAKYGAGKATELYRQEKKPHDPERYYKLKEKLKKSKEKGSGNPSLPPSSDLLNGVTETQKTNDRTFKDQGLSPIMSQEDDIKKRPPRPRVNGVVFDENRTQLDRTEVEFENAVQDIDQHEEIESESSVENIKTVKRSLQASQQVNVRTEVKSKQDARLVSSRHSSLLHHSTSGSRPLRQCSSVTELRLGDKMETFLRSHGVTSPTSIQSVMWPALARLSSLVAVAGPGSGKTLGWVLPLLAGLEDKEQYR